MDAVNLSRLLTWLQRTNLTERLDTSINVTYLSPYNAAFAGINNSYPLDDMLEDLLFHTLPGSIYTTELRDGQIIESLSEGKEVQVTKDENGTVSTTLLLNPHFEITRQGILTGIVLFQWSEGHCWKYRN